MLVELEQAAEHERSLLGRSETILFLKARISGVCSTEKLSLGRFPTNLLSACDLTHVLPQARSAGMYPSDSQGTGSGVTYFGLKSQGRLYADHGSATRFFKQVTL